MGCGWRHVRCEHSGQYFHCCPESWRGRCSDQDWCWHIGSVWNQSIYGWHEYQWRHAGCRFEWQSWRHLWRSEPQRRHAASFVCLRQCARRDAWRRRRHDRNGHWQQHFFRRHQWRGCADQDGRGHDDSDRRRQRDGADDGCSRRVADRQWQHNGFDCKQYSQ